jgi:D-3-phosphoglycerate dehydrogenase / 2-oxoglutarate reductase
MGLAGVVSYAAIVQNFSSLSNVARESMARIFLTHVPDMLATPHAAGLTPQAIEHQAFDTVHQVADRMPPHAVNADAATRLARLRKP